MTDKQALTTGEAAKYCGVNFRTVIRWIERGHLDAYKLPGRGDNRIPVDTFVDFLKKNDMPVPEELVADDRRLLLFSLPDTQVRELAADLRRNSWDVILSDDPVQLGYLIAKDKPSALLMMDAGHVDVAARIMKEVSKDRSDSPKMALLQNSSKDVHDGWDSFQWPEQRQMLLDYLMQDGSDTH
ncbi:MAG TPA: response regulator [Oceanospirillales bacterium]|nr:response regulator [Oleispira sp.]HCM06634.1 response regulator [Oceanospirillales bacterium]